MPPQRKEGLSFVTILVCRSPNQAQACSWPQRKKFDAENRWIQISERHFSIAALESKGQADNFVQLGFGLAAAERERASEMFPVVQR